MPRGRQRKDSFWLWLLLPLIALAAWSLPGLATSVDVGFEVHDTTLVVSGTTSPNAFVTIQEDGATIGTTTADSSGSYSKTLTAQTTGSRNITVFARDSNNLTTDSVTTNINVQAKQTTTLDLFLPPTISLERHQLTAGQNLRLNGETAPHAQVVVVLNDTTNFTVVANANGVWGFELATSSLSSGEHTVYAKATDPDGNQSLSTLKRSFSVSDPDAPTPPTPTPPTPIVATPRITYPAHGQAFTHNNIEVRGLSGPDVLIELYDADTLIGTVFSNSHGNWRLQITLSKAVYDLRARACLGSNCSGFSDTVRIFYTAADIHEAFSISANQLHFYTNTRRSIQLVISYHGGSPPYRTYIDWGDGKIARQDIDETPSTHRYLYTEPGRYNGSVTAIDNAGREARVNFTVIVNQFSWVEPFLAFAVLLFLILLLIIWLWRRRRDKDEDEDEDSVAATTDTLKRPDEAKAPDYSEPDRSDRF